MEGRVCGVAEDLLLPPHGSRERPLPVARIEQRAVAEPMVDDMAQVVAEPKSAAKK